MSSEIPATNSSNDVEPLSWWQRHSRRVLLVARIVLILLVAAGTAWWFLLAPVAVTTHTISAGTVKAEVMGTGTLEARTSAVIGPKIGGLITEVFADEGDRVTVGALLFRLEDNDIRQQVRMAEAEVAAAAAAIDRLRAAQQKAEAVLVQAETNYKRTSDLLTDDVGTQQELDRAFEALSVAKADLASTAAAIIEGQMRLNSAERSLAFHSARLEDTTVEVPFDGLVVRRDRDPGDVVTSGSSVFEVISTDEMWVTAWVDENELASLQVGLPAHVVFRSEPGADFNGTVARVGREVDRETREIVVDVRVDRLPSNWAVGQRAEVYIGVDRRDAVPVLPAELVRVRDGMPFVIVNEVGRARSREITVGLRGREFVEIKTGLTPGDVVVSAAENGGREIREGRRISQE